MRQTKTDKGLRSALQVVREVKEAIISPSSAGMLKTPKASQTTSSPVCRQITSLPGKLCVCLRVCVCASCGQIIIRLFWGVIH